MLGRTPTEFEWQAIQMRTSSVDREFVYAITTTKIFCKPSCPSCKPDVEHVRIYKNSDLAMESGYYPCKRCKPGGLKLSNQDWTNQMNAYMDQYYQEHITLRVLADEFHSSPYHLQRIYKSVKGYTPTEYLQKVRIQRAVELLKHTYLSVEEIGHQVGLHNTSYFITLFKNLVGTTPKQYKKTLES